MAHIVEFWPEWDKDPDDGRPGPNLRAAMARKKSYKELGFTQTWKKSITELPFVEPGIAALTATGRMEAAPRPAGPPNMPYAADPTGLPF